MSGQAKKVDLEQRANVETVVLPFKVTIKCHTTDASIRAFTDLNSIKVYSEEDGQTAPSDASFPTLDDDAAPGVFGIYASVGDALYLSRVTVQPASIVNGGSLAMTAAVFTYEGDVAASPGVTSSKNISLGISCTGLDPDSEIADCTFIVSLEYVRDMRQAS